MSSIEPQEKYTFRRTFAANKESDKTGDPSKAEVQGYINELLGIKKDPKADKWATV